MRSIEWKVVIKDGQIASLEHAVGLSNTSVEDNLLIIGILENLKRKHQNNLETQFDKTIRKGKRVEAEDKDSEDLDDLGDGC